MTPKPPQSTLRLRSVFHLRRPPGLQRMPGGGSCSTSSAPSSSASRIYLVGGHPRPVEPAAVASTGRRHHNNVRHPHDSRQGETRHSCPVCAGQPRPRISATMTDCTAGQCLDLPRGNPRDRGRAVASGSCTATSSTASCGPARCSESGRANHAYAAALRLEPVRQCDSAEARLPVLVAGCVSSSTRSRTR